MIQRRVESPTPLNILAKVLAQSVYMVLGCAIAVTLMQNLNMIHLLSEI